MKINPGLLNLYKGNVQGKGTLPNSENLSIDDIKCGGCLSGLHRRKRLRRMSRVR
jgi:hypothetical protein